MHTVIQLLTRMMAVGVIVGLVHSIPESTAWAESAKSRYLKGDACYRDLRNDPRRQKYRDPWLQCIRKFEGVYRFDPSGPWAAAGLYMSGKLYLELHRRSGRGADLQEARDIFQRIVKRYPDSRYRQRARDELKTLEARSPKASESRQDGKIRDAYQKAEKCYRRLKADPDRSKYRDQWLKCIDGFDKVYRRDPDGSYAPAALYMAGRLYGELADRSYLGSDRSESLKRIDRLRRNFPESDYTQRATRTPAIESPSSASAARKPPAAVKQRFDAAETCYRRLLANPRRQKYREFWLNCIDDFDTAYRAEPDGPLAAASLYRSAELYRELHGKSYLSADLEQSRERFEQVWQRFPDTDHGLRAADALGIPESRRVARKKAEAAAEKKERAADADPSDAIAAVIQQAGPATTASSKGPDTGDWVMVEGLRYWSNPSYTRVVIDANQETGFSHHLLKKDPSLGKPQRLYVDLDRTRLGAGIPKTVPIDDDLLMDARAGQYTPDSVRVVVDIKSFETYKIFSLKNPFRIVIDVWGERKTEPPARISTPGLPKDGSVGPGSLAQQLALGVRRIVVDPGHGGRDFGAPGYLRGVHEKKVVLELGRRLAEKLRKRLRCEVVMTRSTDRYLTLEERTAIANTKNADLFVSIHTNSARSRKAYGIETYFLNLATDEDAILVAARENATSTKNISDLQTILSDLMKNAKINESSRLAGHVQTEMVGYLKKRYSRIRSKGVKQAPFYVLLGAQMPAILVETSFISNPRECKRLIDPKYQDHLAEAIAEGIVSYVKETNPAAFSNAAFGGNRAGG